MVIDVKIKEDKQTDWSKDKLENTELQSPTGQSVELSDIAELEESTTPNKIETKAGDEIATVSAKITNDDVGGTSQKIMSKVNHIDTPSNVKVNVGGANEDISNAITQLAMAMLAAIIIVYLVLVLTFKGALAPFTILFSSTMQIQGCSFRRRKKMKTDFQSPEAICDHSFGGYLARCGSMHRKEHRSRTHGTCDIRLGTLPGIR